MRRLALLVTVVALVACNNDSLVNGAGSSPDNPDAPTPASSPSDPNDPGLAGGHFDLDTSSQYYQADHGTTDHHVHRYDDIYDVTSVDFFDMLDPHFTQIASRVAPNQQFYVIVANADLSPGARLAINGTQTPVTEYQGQVQQGFGALTKYTLASLTSFKLEMDADAIITGGLIPTDTGCVRSNKPGAHGEYRDGALTVQILDANTAAIDPATGTATANGGLLWEATVFWHEAGVACY